MDRSISRPTPENIWLTGGHVVDVNTGTVQRDTAVEVVGGRIARKGESSEGAETTLDEMRAVVRATGGRA